MVGHDVAAKRANVLEGGEKTGPIVCQTTGKRKASEHVPKRLECAAFAPCIDELPDLFEDLLWRHRGAWPPEVGYTAEHRSRRL